MIHIDVIEHCNFSCYFCAAKDIITPRMMDPALFKKIVDESAECGVEELNLVPMKGEPFLHPGIYDMLDYATQHMKMLNIFSNATAINVDKLKRLNMAKITLNISQYGHTVEEFVELTKSSPRLWDIFHSRLSELKAAGVHHNVFVRTKDYDFDYDEHRGANVTPFNGISKCKYHHQPRVYPNGDVTFCLFIESETTGASSVMFGNANITHMRDILEHPIRYKFYDSQKICVDFCQSHDRDCLNRINMTTIRLIHSSKKKYQANPTTTDHQYDNIYDDIDKHRPSV